MEKHGAYFFAPAMGQFGRAGVPDLVCCLAGVFVGIECKAGKGAPTELQLLELRKILAAGGHAVIVWDREEDIQKLDTLLECIACGLKPRPDPHVINAPLLEPRPGVPAKGASQPVKKARKS